MASFLERLLFGREALERAAEAEKRLIAAKVDRAQIEVQYDQARARLTSLVEKTAGEAKKLKSNPPAELTLRPPSSADLGDMGDEDLE